LATAAELSSPDGIAVDAAGDLFIADFSNNCIREVNTSTGIITTVAGNGSQGYSGDGGLATAAEINSPGSVAVEANGDLFIADSGNNCVREVNANTHVISTVAGNGTSGYSGDGGLATTAELNFPGYVAVDASGNLFIADTYNSVIRSVNASTGVITTVAGTRTAGYGGDGGLATSAGLYGPCGVAVDAGGNLFIADTNDNRVREVVSASVRVAQATLSVTASSTSKTYGQTLSFAGTEFATSGLVGDDSVTSVTLASAGTAASAALGTYTIACSAAVGSGLSNYAITYVNGALTVTLGTGISLNDSTLQVGADFSTTAPITIGTGGGTVDTNGYNLVLAGPLTGPGGLAKIGSGSVTLSSTNSYQGGTTVYAGTLIATNPSAIAANTSLVIGAGGSFVFDPSSYATGTSSNTTDTVSSGVASTASNVASAATSSTTSAVTVAPVTTNVVSPSPAFAKKLFQKAPPSPPVPLPWRFDGYHLPIVVAGPVTAASPPASLPQVVEGISKTISQRIGGDPACFAQAANASQNSDRHPTKDVAIRALETVFAQYGR